MVPPYSLGICPPTNPETLWSPITPSSRKNWFSEGIFFWQITQMALESPKIDICQNWPRRVLGDVIRCLESKFDKKIPMGSVPNCWKEIPVRHAIRWFKCKLKPPKNEIIDTMITFVKFYRFLIQEKLEKVRLCIQSKSHFWHFRFSNVHILPVVFSNFLKNVGVKDMISRNSFSHLSGNGFILSVFDSVFW